MDEREDKPSSSIAERLWLCPASWRMSQGLPRLSTPEMDAYAETGDRVHLYCEAPEFVDLSEWPEELDVAKQCLEEREELIRSISWPVNSFREYKEKRLWLTKAGLPRHRVKIFSGRVDYARVAGGVGLVTDYKSGRGDVAPNHKNAQLKTQLALLHFQHNLDWGYTKIIQPLNGTRAAKPCCYERSELEQAVKDIYDLCEQIEDPKAPFRPCEQACKFCPARLKCPAATEVLRTIQNFELTKLVGLSGKEVAALLESCEAAETVIAAAKSHAKAMLKLSNEAVPGWHLADTGSTRTITSPLATFEALSAASLVDREGFLKIVKVGIGDLERAIRKFNPTFSQKDAREAVETHAAITTKAKEPTLKRVKE